MPVRILLMVNMIQKPPVRYRSRCIKHIPDWGFFYFLLASVYSWYLNGWVFIGFSLFFFYYIIRRSNEAIMYIVGIEEREDEIVINFLRFDNGPFEKVISKNNLDAEFFEPSKGEINSDRIIIKCNDNLEFVQYAVGKWNKQDLISLYHRFKRPVTYFRY